MTGPIPSDDTPLRSERIWNVIAMIPAGKVASYAQVAAAAGLPGRARYVGYALKHLPAKTSLPWHRVIQASRRIASRAPSQMQRQRELLAAEGVRFNGERVLSQHVWEV